MTLLNFLISVWKILSLESRLSLLETWKEKLMKNNFGDRRVEETHRRNKKKQKTATSLITKQLIKAKHPFSSENVSRLPPSFTANHAKRWKPVAVVAGCFWRSGKRDSTATREKGNCDNNFLCIIIIKSRRRNFPPFNSAIKGHFNDVHLFAQARAHLFDA